MSCLNFEGISVKPTRRNEDHLLEYVEMCHRDMNVLASHRYADEYWFLERKLDIRCIDFFFFLPVFFSSRDFQSELYSRILNSRKVKI
jgi:hypothetical protein